MKQNPEKERLLSCVDDKTWKKWGPYLSERQWGTVREDYGPDGEAWNFITHDKARSYAYRWGEDGIGGICDAEQILCLSPAFWNGQDPIIKERLFGLTNGQGNHGEDVKELYFHMDSSPTHSYCKYLYKYPQNSYPYEELVLKNRIGRTLPEFELLDTEVFKEGRYFDCFIEYAKVDPEDILMKITVYNRGPEAHRIDVLPQLWFRNYWKHNPRYSRPIMFRNKEGVITTQSSRNGEYNYYHLGGQALFCENETNKQRIYHTTNDVAYVKDGINDHIVYGSSTVDPTFKGTKAAVWFSEEIEPGGSRVFRTRLSKREHFHPWKDFDEVFEKRKAETDLYYDILTPKNLTDEQGKLLRNALGGLLWSKQFYYLDVFKWLFGEPGETAPNRLRQRNFQWQHLTNRDIISMPDKWEYPWYAAWDLAFHTTTFAEVDPLFAKGQLLLMLTEYYMHPNGQIPAYEWNFSDVNPPVHSWAVWEVFLKDKKHSGRADYSFLEKCYHKLLVNFTWWVNQKDKDGLALFEGGFLGLDNIGVFDRSRMPTGIQKMQQADATSWMALFTLNMLRMSLELAMKNSVYEESAAKFFRQFLNIGWSMHNISGQNVSLWDNEDAFYYDVVQMKSGYTDRMRVRSLVGIIPLFAVEVIHKDLLDRLDEFQVRAEGIIRTRPDLASLISRIEEVNEEGSHLFSIMRGYRLEQVLKWLLDENEFLSEYGIRSLSKYHKDHPFVFEHHGMHRIEYVSGESNTGMFGGNSNWRGPIWFPLNYLIIRSLLRFYDFYGPEYIYEFPTGSDQKLNLRQIAIELTKRLLKLFERNEEGRYQYHTDDVDHLFADDEHFRELHLFYEFFDGDSGRGLGASHQTGWTALIANLLLELEEMESM
ncbi:MAG: glucosidase [Saprospiraceae bacterium]|nr:glucosidase [Lewinella sp.]